jgi:hypothetical protein
MKNKDTKGSSAPVQELILDWRSYYISFRKLHGDHPVIFRGRQLFPDGWTYSQKDYRGPEWPPPSKPEELLELQLFYWRRRRAIISQELGHTKSTMDSLVQLQSGRSAPLHHRAKIIYTDPEGEEVVVIRKQPLSMDWFKGRLMWLTHDLDNCNQQLKTLEGQGDTSGSTHQQNGRSTHVQR